MLCQSWHFHYWEIEKRFSFSSTNILIHILFLWFAFLTLFYDTLPTPGEWILPLVLLLIFYCYRRKTFQSSDHQGREPETSSSSHFVFICYSLIWVYYLSLISFSEKYCINKSLGMNGFYVLYFTVLQRWIIKKVFITCQVLEIWILNESRFVP